MTDVPSEPERRLVIKGRSIDDGAWTTLLVVRDAQGCWSISLDAPAVRLSRADMVALAQAVLFSDSGHRDSDSSSAP